MPQGHPQDYDRGTSDYTRDSDKSSSSRYHSDIILTLQMVDILIFCEGILTATAHGRVRILTNKLFLHQNALG